MKTRIIIILTVLLITTYTFAQTPEWLWAESAGGLYFDYGTGISTDADGNVYVTGSFGGTATFGTYDITSNGGSDIFVAKMDSYGNWLWAENAGGINGEYASSISTDSDENVYVTGDFLETMSFGSYELTSNGSQDIFVAKMDSYGNWLWAENAGGNYIDSGRAISTDTDGNVYVAGWYENTASFGSFSLTSSGENDIFVAKMDSDGNWLWSESAGGSIDDKVRGICTDTDGNIYVIGDFEDTATFGSFNINSSGERDIFVAKLDSNGNWLWVESAGGSSWENGKALSTDTYGNVYVTGWFEIAASFGSYNVNSIDGVDIFLAKLDSNGNWLWAESAGGSNIDDVYKPTHRLHFKPGT